MMFWQIVLGFCGVLWFAHAWAQARVASVPFEGWAQLGAVGVVLALFALLLTKIMPARDKEFRDALRDLTVSFRDEMKAERETFLESQRIMREQYNEIAAAHRQIAQNLQSVSSELRERRWDGKTERRRSGRS